MPQFSRRLDAWIRRVAGALALLCVIGVVWQVSWVAAEPAIVIPPPAVDAPKVTPQQ